MMMSLDHYVWSSNEFPQMIRYLKNFDINKTMSFKVGDNKLLKSTTKYGKKLTI